LIVLMVDVRQARARRLENPTTSNRKTISSLESRKSFRSRKGCSKDVLAERIRLKR
jgi:hypothetical protein